MITEDQAHQAIANRTLLRDFDGETGIPQAIDTDGETIIVHISTPDFSRWSDTLDLSIADEQSARADQAAAEAARRENESPGGMYYGTQWASNA